MERFELDRLTSYDDESLIAEVRRVAALVPHEKMTEAAFNEHGRVHSSTLRKRFGAWKEILIAAGLAQRHDGRTARRDRDELLAQVKEVARKLGTSSLRKGDFLRETGLSDRPVLRVFGSWRAALTAAGLGQAALGKRYSDEECFENLLAVWTHYGRPPRHQEMTRPPSRVGPKAYVRRWGSWRKALAAFTERVNAEPAAPAAAVAAPVAAPENRSSASVPTTARGVPLGLRYRVLARDRFRCVLCGQSPATSISVSLHVDHVIPWSRGGQTVFENLRSLCQNCNLGKGDRVGIESAVGSSSD